MTAVAVLLWTHSILYARFEIGYFGLIHGLPITFFIALALLTIASVTLWVSKGKHGKLLCLQLLVFISALWLIPLITGGSPPFTDHAYRNLGMVDYIVRQAHFDSTVLLYQSWPGTFILSAMAVKIGSINFEPLLGVFPFFMQILYLLPLYVFLKNTLGEARSNYWWAGAWLFYLANWGGSGYFGPQVTALFLLLTLLALVTSASIWKKDSKSFTLLGMVFIVFAALVVTHFLTSLAALSILGVICLVKKSKSMALVVGLCVLLVMCWALTGAETWVSRILSGQELFTADPVVVGEREITGHFTGSESHVAVATSRLPFSVIFALIGLIGAILACLVKRKFSTAIPILAIALAPLILLPLSIHYAGEFTQRLYLFALIPMAYFGVELFDIRNRAVTFVFCLLLVICVPLHVIAHYGNETMDYFSPGQVNGLHFFHDNTSGGYVTGAWPMGEMKNAERYQRIGFDQLCLQNDVLVIEGEIDQDLPHYVAISRQDREYYRFFRGIPEFIEEIELKLESAVNYGLIYDSADLKLCANESIDAAEN